MTTEYPRSVYHLRQNGQEIGYWTSSFVIIMRLFWDYVDRGEMRIYIWKDEWLDEDHFDEYSILEQRGSE